MAKSKPAPLRERDITRHIAREYYKEFDQLIESDVIIVGAGPSGLICAHDLATMGFRTLIVEQSLALGGGFWHGGYLMNKATICEPANEILEEIGVPCKRIKECEGMYMVDPPHATGALVAAGTTHLLYWTLTAPINKVWLKGQVLSPAGQVFFGAGGNAAGAEDWTVLRDRWERSHLYRAATSTFAFLLLAVAAGI